MDSKRPPQARRPMVPLAAAATVVQALPSRAPAREVPLGSLAIALAVVAGAFVASSPLMDLFGAGHGWAWRFLAFWGEAGGLAALLGMLFRQPVLSWVGAAVFLAVALMLSGAVWAAHPLALALVGAVAAWQVRRQARRGGQRRPDGWLQA